MLKITSAIKSPISFILLTGLFLLSGCSIVPGTHISTSQFSNHSDGQNLAVDLVPISAALIKEIKIKNKQSEAQYDSALQQKISQYTYKVGVGDVLNITVWDHPELTIPAGQFRSAGETGNVVHPDGTIFYPYVGKVPVEGKHVTQIRDLITQKLGEYIEAPQIDVSVAAYRSQKVFVSGAVAQPANIPITNVPLTLLDALNACGGMSPDADWRSVVLTTEGEGVSNKEVLDLYALYQQGDMSQNRLLGPSDIVHVPRNDGLKVFVMGDVIKAETQRIDRSGLTLAEALNNAGGVNEASASAKGIFVLRASQAEDKLVDVYQLDASTGSMLVLSTQFELQPLDIVYVTSAPIARWNRVVAQFIPTIRGLYEIDRTIND
ncbi:MAG: polysaccharide export protein [Porticoccaceae bacterium]|nr:polysaccharide export protein [Porticoccaceae bacterium]